ncbi:MAG: riboflavin synthase [Verrucomicrobiia bacterium]
MFTGIIEETGTVALVQPSGTGIRLGVLARLCSRGTKVGDSIAVNGCCLTVVRTTRRKGGTLLEFDLLQETWKRTNLHATGEGGAVNLERSLPAEGRMGGHFVTGHVDGTGRIRRWEPSGSDWVLDVAARPELMRYMVFKGAVALDGISLTVADVTRDSFRIWIIPHTYEVTALRERKVGDLVNVEADLLGKYVEKLLALREPARGRRRS